MAEFVNADPPDTADKLIGHASKARSMDVTAGKLRTHHTVNLATDAVANGLHAAGAFRDTTRASLDDDGRAEDGQPIEEGMEHGIRYGGRSMIGHTKRRHGGNAGAGMPAEAAPTASTAGGSSRPMPATPFSNAVGVPPVNSGPATASAAGKPSIRPPGIGFADGAKTRAFTGMPSVSDRGIRPSDVLARFMPGKANVSGAASPASNIAKGFANPAGNVTRLAQLAVQGVRRIAAGTVSAMTGAVGAPLFLLLAGVIAVVAILAALLSWLPGFSATRHGCDDTVRTEIAIPEGAEPWVAKAAESSGLPREFIAAMMTIESGFRPDVYADDVNGGTWGLLQLNRTEWRKIHPQGSDLTPPEGITDPMIHAELGGQYLKTRLEGVRRLKAANPTAEFGTLDDLEALVIAHNAGEGNLMNYPNIPAITRTYLTKMRAMTGGMGAGAECVAVGGMIGVLDPPLAMNADNTAANLDAMDMPAIGSYERWQCTWWAASRRAMIGKPVDPYMGHGYMWSDSARKFGYPIDKHPRPGDVMVFQTGVLGASGVYGHVAIVEEVREDGGIVISESSASAARVTLRTLTSQQLEASHDGIDFIH